MVHSYLKITVSGDDCDFFLDTYVKNLKEKNFINVENANITFDDGK